MIRAVAALVMAIAAWPAFRAVSSGAIWRASPHLAVKLLLAVSVGSAAAIAIAAFAPLPVVTAVAVVAALVTVGDALARRAGRGVAAGLPPGSLGVLPLGPWRNQGFYAAQARRYGAVFKARQIVRPLACINDLPVGRRLLKEADADLVAPPLGFSRFIPGGYLRYRAPAEHASYKNLFRLAFSRDVADARSAQLHAGFRNGLTAVAAEGAEIPPRARVNRILFPLWAGLYSGLEPDAPETARLKELSRVIDTRNPRWVSDRRVRAAAAELGEIFVAQRTRFDALPDDEVPRCFLDEIRRHEPSSLDDPAVLGNLVFLFHVTWGDVSGLLTWIARMLAGHPAVVLAARAELAPGADDGPAPRDSLCTRIVHETLRLEQSEHIYRRTTSSVTVADRTIPSGWIVRVGVHEAHRNPTVFERPDTFDPDRFLGRSYAKDEYSPFGAHRLACLGEQVTVAVARTFTEELVTGFDLETTRDGPAELGSWGHWAPSSRWRLALSPVAGGAAS
jgi:cytochrome P450